jgi:hypothetical protein
MCVNCRTHYAKSPIDFAGKRGSGRECAEREMVVYGGLRPSPTHMRGIYSCSVYGVVGTADMDGWESKERLQRHQPT